MNVQRLSTYGFGLCLCLLLAPDSAGHFGFVDVRKVQVDRLVANLEKVVKEDPKNEKAVINLARVHAMAYAKKTETAEVYTDRGKVRGVWFGYIPKLIPFSEVKRAGDDDKQKAARSHLNKAVLGFREAVKLAPDNMVARMGLAWTLDQSGEKAAAIQQYRALIDENWDSEGKLHSLPLNGETVVTEAAGYLIPLLDKEEDKSEIVRLRARVSRMRNLSRPITPVAVPLRDSLRARDIEDGNASVPFDADGSGLKQNWTWITKDAGWLVYDPKNERRITSGLELFGSVTFWLFWNTGYDALAALDDNHDGVLTGSELVGLAIWQDSDHRGVCDPGEVKPLSEYGIVAVSCRFERDTNHPDKIAFSPAGVTFRDGTTRPTFDLVLKPRDRHGARGSARR